MDSFKYDNELHIYRALIYDNCKENDDRLQVRVMPYMADIVGEDEQFLPKYPPFVKGKTIRGYTEVDSSKNNNQISSVYVLASSDFTLGYVLDLVNENPGSYKDPLISSWQYSSVKEVLSISNTTPKNFNYEDLIVTQNVAGNFIEITSYKDPFKIIMTTYGDIFTIQEHRIFMMARADYMSGSKNSYIEITPEKITCQAKVFDLSKSEKVILGHKGMCVMGTMGIIPTTVGGVNLTPCTNIKL